MSEVYRVLLVFCVIRNLILDISIAIECKISTIVLVMTTMANSKIDARVKFNSLACSLIKYYSPFLYPRVYPTVEHDHDGRDEKLIL